MDNLHPIRMMRQYRACLTVALIGLFSLAAVPSFGQITTCIPDAAVACGAIPAGPMSVVAFNGLGGLITSPVGAIVTVTFTDAAPAPANCVVSTVVRTYTVTINGTPYTCATTYTVTAPTPVLAAPVPNPLVIACGAPLPAPSTLAYTNSPSPCLVAGVSSPSTFSAFTPTCGGGGLYTETWSATVCGLAAPLTRTRVITVLPGALPVMTPPAPITIACGAPLPAVVALPYTNNGVGTCLITGNSTGHTFSALPGACGGPVTETWTATDPCVGVLAPVTRIITVLPAALPVIPAQAPTTIACGALVPTILPYTNGLAAPCLISGTVASTFSPATLPACGGTTTETWAGVDACGRALTPVSRVVTVLPATLPTIAAPAALAPVTCDAIPAPSALPYTNGLAAPCLLSGNTLLSTLSPASVPCTGGVITETWTGTDACGRALAPVTRTITVTGSIASPTMIAPANITGSCGTLPAASRLPFTNGLTGRCLKTGMSGYSTFSTLPACAGTVIETWAATDDCGRALPSVSRTITCSSGLSCSVTKVSDSNCDGYTGSATAKLTGGTAASYKWDNRETTETATQLSQGYHNVTITSTAGCVTICSVLIGNSTTLACSAVANSPSACNRPSGSATVTATGGGTNVRYLWDNQETTATATRLSAGPHTVKVISGNCSKTCSVEIEGTGGTLSMGACTKTNANCNNKGGVITGGPISGNTGRVTYTWRNAANEIIGNTQQVANVASGTYTLTVKDGCSEERCSVTVGRSTTNCETSNFYPVATTCCTYSNESSQPLKYLGYKTTANKITAVNPASFYYYAKVVAPSANFTVNITQTKDVAAFKSLDLNKDNIQLWDANCEKSTKGVVTANNGRVAIKGATVGATYVLAVRLEAGQLVGTTVTSATASASYTFASYINNVLVPNSKSTIRLKAVEQELLNAGTCQHLAPVKGSAVLNTELSVQPNPAQSVVSVMFEAGVTGEAVVSVANINGAIVQTMNHEATQGENIVSLNIQELPVGMYIVTVKTAQQWMTKQLVIVR
jgi:Secretion system C-terminal sorting domain